MKAYWTISMLVLIPFYAGGESGDKFIQSLVSHWERSLKEETVKEKVDFPQIKRIAKAYSRIEPRIQKYVTSYFKRSAKFTNSCRIFITTYGKAGKSKTQEALSAHHGLEQMKNAKDIDYLWIQRVNEKINIKTEMKKTAKDSSLYKLYEQILKNRESHYFTRIQRLEKEIELIHLRQTQQILKQKISRLTGAKSTP